MMSDGRGHCALVLAFGFLAGACGGGQRADEAGESGLTGVVLETMDASGYTYAHVELADADVWAAGPVTPLEVGDTVVLVDTMYMGVFKSQALDRTFDDLFFVVSFGGSTDVLGSGFGMAEQVIDTGGYTYVEVNVGGDTFWLAGPQLEIAEGAFVEWKGPMLMTDFYSSSLDRTFDEILFVDSIWHSR